MLAILGRLSRLLNRLAFGQSDQTLCARMAVANGADCRFCRLIGWAVGDSDHCAGELRWWLGRSQ